jgi:hypothetical protein
MKQKKSSIIWKKTAVLVIASSTIAVSVLAQDANTGITSATDNVKGYFANGVNLMYAIGAILGLVGAVKVYQKWSHGDQDTSKVAASWFGSCIFLVVVATILKAFFAV